MVDNTNHYKYMPNEPSKPDRGFSNQTLYTHNEVVTLLMEANLMYNVDIILVLICSIFIFLMQMGFAMIEAGTIRSKNC